MDVDIKRPSDERREKKTRRRLRLSCVECTKRRQKCDRNYPCSLCISRGVSHLCRWETVPVARPTPARPPAPVQKASAENDNMIRELSARIASLERALADQKTQRTDQADDQEMSSPDSTLATDKTTPCTSPCSDSTRLSSFSPEPLIDDGGIAISIATKPLAATMYDTTSTLAQLSLAHHGEYIGRGSLICALHSISAGNTPRFLYAKSTDATSVYRELKPGFPSGNFGNALVDQLVSNIPSVPVTTALVQAFFSEVNWRFGIPEQWFWSACSQMWIALQYPDSRGLQINPNWLSLFFAVLAFAPQDALQVYQDVAPVPTEESCDTYYSCAMTARRVAEDEHLNKPSLSLMSSAADGTVLGCLAVPLLCNYLAERGRVSEGWKLVGSGIRNAEAVGMHRDPGWRQWQVMSEDERILRRRAWWGLVIWDKMYSFMLGRPQMIRREIFDVALPLAVDQDGTRDIFNLGQAVFIQLASIVGETLEKCFCVEYPNCPVFFELDYKFKQWEEHLPREYQHIDNEFAASIEGLSHTESTILTRQRWTFTTWYLLIRMKLHIAAITGQGRTPQLPAHIRQSRGLCILLAMKLIRLQCDTYDSATLYEGTKERALPGSNWFFEGCFSLFEAAVALVTTLTRHPWLEKLSEAEALIDRALGVFNRVVQAESGKRGEIARMAVEVLTSLGKEHWWRAQRPNGNSVNQDVRSDNNSQRSPGRSPLGAVGGNGQAPSVFNARIGGISPSVWYMPPDTSANFLPPIQYNLSASRDRSPGAPATNVGLFHGVDGAEKARIIDLA